MSIANFEESGLVSQPVRSRSQLVTNRFLIALSQVFGLGAFTSRGISKRFGSDFLKTAKILSRMSKRPYYLLSAVHVTRPYGGYENSYTISTKGWSKISYLQRHSAPAPLPVEEGGSIILGASRAQIEGVSPLSIPCIRQGYQRGIYTARHSSRGDGRLCSPN